MSGKRKKGGENITRKKRKIYYHQFIGVGREENIGKTWIREKE